MIRIRCFAAMLVLLVGGQAFAESPSIEGGRVETMGELESFKPYGEIERLGLFLREPGAVELPNLRRAGFLTIELIDRARGAEGSRLAGLVSDLQHSPSG